MATSTRVTEEFPIFGRVCDLSDKQLPTHEDLIKCILYRQISMKKIGVAKILQYVISVEMWPVM